MKNQFPLIGLLFGALTGLALPAAPTGISAGIAVVDLAPPPGGTRVG